MPIDFRKFKLISEEEMKKREKEREERDKLTASKLAQMLRELVALEDGLSSYELEFIEDHSHKLEQEGELQWYYGLSSKQSAFLQRVYDERA